MADAKFCPKCGYSNPPQRGACLMCYAPLDQSGGGLQCPHCGGEVAESSSFCTGCGGAVVESAVSVPSAVALAAVVVEAAEGVFGATDYAEAEVGEVAEAGFEEALEAVEEPPTPGEELAAEAVPEPIPEPVAGEEGPAEEEMFVPPPPGVVEPPAEEVAGEVAPPPPPEEEAFAAPPPPPDTVGLEEEAAVEEPPPPPPDALDLSAEEADKDPDLGWKMDLPGEEDQE